MFNSLPILSLITFSPLLGVLILLFMPKHKGKWIKIIAIATTFIPLVLSGLLFANFDHQLGEPQFQEVLRFIHIPLSQESELLAKYTSYNFEFKYMMSIDGISLPLIFLTALIAAMAALASFQIKKRWKTFYILFLLLEMGMFGVFMAQDLFLFFVFFEATLVPMFFLIGIWGYFEREKAANKFLIYNGIGSAVMLFAFIILITTAGFVVNQTSDTAAIVYSGDINTIMQNLTEPQSLVNLVPDPEQGGTSPFYLSEAMRWTLFILLLAAFGIKLPIFPFHTWMLKVHTEAPPSIVMIHSGILLKMGAFGLLRFGIGFFPDIARDFAFVLAILGVINIIYGAILAFVQKDFKLVLAYSSISHMGVVLLGIAAFNQIGLEGAVYQMVSHGLISALMFLVVGSLYERTHTTDLRKLGGLAKSLPFISGMLLMGGLASLGLPGLSGFIGEFLPFLGLFDTMPIVTAIGTLGLILSAVYVLRAVLGITYGPIQENSKNLLDARLIEAVPMVILVAFILLLGIYPTLLTEPMQHSFDQLLQTIAARIGG